MQCLRLGDEGEGLYEEVTLLGLQLSGHYRATPEEIHLYILQGCGENTPNGEDRQGTDVSPLRLA